MVKKVLHRGVLLSKVGEESDLWTVKIEGDDEERRMNEEVFGRIVQLGQNVPSSVKHHTKLTQKPRGRPPKSTKSKRGPSTSRKRIEGNESNCTGSSIDRNIEEKSNSTSKESKSSKTRSKVTGLTKKENNSGRRKKKTTVANKIEGKNKSRQAKSKSDKLSRSDLDADVGHDGNSNTRVNTRSSSKKRNISELASPLTFTKKPGCKRRQTGRGGSRIRRVKGEEVEKVKLLTGTLYLYRGDNPRVAFVRHF